MQPPNPSQPKPPLRVVQGGSKSTLPPELAPVSDADLVSHYLAGIELVQRVIADIDEATDIANTCVIQLRDTNRWDPARGSLRTHFLLLVTNELRARRRANKGSALVRRERHGQAYHRETQGEYTMSPEDQLIAREEAAERSQAHAKCRALVRRLRACVADSPEALALLDYWSHAGEELPMPEIARKLGMTEPKLYATKKMIEYHAVKCRDEMEGR